MVNPEDMCIRHLLGEHLETHMFYTHLTKKRKISGFITSNCIEPKSIKIRHDILASFIKNHKSLMNENPDISYLPVSEVNARVNTAKSFSLLMGRCPKCLDKYFERIQKNDLVE